MRPRAQAGFSLLEVVVVLVILGITSAMAIPRTMSGGGASINAGYEAQRLASDLRHAQTLARSGGKCTRLSVASASSYSVTSAAGSAQCTATPWTNVTSPAKNGLFSITLKNGVSVSAPAAVTFNPAGAPLAAVQLSVTGGGKTYTVSVAALTGYVSIT